MGNRGLISIVKGRRVIMKVFVETDAITFTKIALVFQRQNSPSSHDRVWEILAEAKIDRRAMAIQIGKLVEYRGRLIVPESIDRTYVSSFQKRYHDPESESGVADRYWIVEL